MIDPRTRCLLALPLAAALLVGCGGESYDDGSPASTSPSGARPADAAAPATPPGTAGAGTTEADVIRSVEQIQADNAKDELDRLAEEIENDPGG